MKQMLMIDKNSTAVIVFYKTWLTFWGGSWTFGIGGLITLQFKVV